MDQSRFERSYLPRFFLERIWFSKPLMAVAAVILLSVSGCRGTSPSVVPSKLEAIPIATVDPSFQVEWQKIVDLRASDLLSDGLIRRIDRLLSRDPPSELKVAAFLIKGEHFYALGEDAQVVFELGEVEKLIDDARQQGEVISPILEAEVRQLLAFALSRGGDPSRALRLLEDLEKEQELEPAELWGARAVAADRAEEWPLAVYSYMLWRAQLPKDSADAAFADQRVRALLLHLSGPTLVAMAEQVPEHLEPAAACLRGFAGMAHPKTKNIPKWVLQCGDLPGSIGILLPRTGRFAAFADPQAAASVAAVRVLSSQRRVSVLWADSGSDAEIAIQSARMLIQQGAEVIVGPWDPKNARVVIDEISGIDRQVRFVLPGESVSGATGVLPQLESRIQSLIARAKQSKSKGRIRGLVAMVPQNSYGKRAARELNKLHKQGHIKLLNLLEYPMDTTSFKPFIDRLRSGFGRTLVSWLLLDSYPRVELIIRQLQRDGMKIGAGKRQTLVLSLAEGLSRQVVEEHPNVYEGLIVAPLVPARAEQSEFDRAYFEQENSYPDASANLIWEALARAWSSRFVDPSTVPELVRIENGQILPLSAPTPSPSDSSPLRPKSGPGESDMVAEEQ